jgi:hypothetical protein
MANGAAVLPAGAGLVEGGGKPVVALQHPDPRLVPRLDQQALPLGTVGLGPPAVEPMHGHMGQLMAEHFFQEMGVAVPEPVCQANPPLGRPAKAKGRPEAGAELDGD